MDIHTYLKEWAINYFKHRDIIPQAIEKIEPSDNKVLIKYKDRTEVILPLGNLADFNVSQKSDEFISLIVFNTSKNFDTLLRNWADFLEFKNLKLFFINPFSEAEHKWIIAPAVHARISDESSLKKGLQSIFETVPTLSEEELEENIKSIEKL